MEKFNMDLFQQYVSGWKQNHLPHILSCLTEDCIVIESHGPTYQSISDMKRWFEYWKAANSKITKWDILSFSFCEQNNTAYAEWDFSCVSNNQTYSFPGISVIKFTEEKISFIHEYRMTHQAYLWQRDTLKSE